jgi:DNA (cytosine-5)-methyltransferase 1
LPNLKEKKAMIRLLYIDLFCGAGGTSTGVEAARIGGEKCAKVIACVNHDAHAIASHAANHPDALHFTEDIRTLDIAPLAAHLAKCRKLYPGAKVVLWASLECTNFSKAKGGLPRDADSRTLAEHLFRYIEILNPDYIQIENVEEFMSWGDMDQNGKPISRDKGRSYMRWVNRVRSYGYYFDHRILNAADFGAYTIRKRFFAIFGKKGLPIVFPVATHARNGNEGFEVFGETYYRKWKPVREVLDLNDEGESIFNRHKPLCEKTLERIYAGLIKFVAGGKETFIVKYNSVNQKTKKYVAPGIDEPCPTVAAQNRLGLAKVHFLSKHFSGDPESKNISVEQPAGSVTCKDHHSFVTAYFGNGYNRSVDEPAPTVTTDDRFALVTTKFYQNEYSGGGQLSSLDEPNPAVMTTPKQKLVSVRQYLMNPQFQSAGGSIDDPAFTLIASMNKRPPYLITTKEGIGIAIYDSDSPMTIRIKEFMAMYGIMDICMRMLRVDELKRIMGFPTDYILVGTQSEQKKFLGNAVEVNMARALVESLANCIRA